MAENRIRIQKQLEKSVSPFSLIRTNASNEAEYVATSALAFSLTDGITTEAIAPGDTLTVSTQNGLTAVVSATDLLTLGIQVSADANNDLTFGTDGKLYLSKNDLITGVAWDDATNKLVLTFDSGATVDVPIVDAISSWLFDFTISDGTVTDVVNNHETLVFVGTGGLKATVSPNQVSYGLQSQVDTFLGLTSGSTVTLTQTPLTVLSVSRNGLDQIAGATEDYTIAGTVITFNIGFGSSPGGAGVENIKVMYTY